MHPITFVPSARSGYSGKPRPATPTTPEELKAFNIENTSWQAQVACRFKSVDSLRGLLNNLPELSSEVEQKFSTSVTPYLAALMDTNDVNCPIRKQYLPSEHEEEDNSYTSIDSLDESGDTVAGTSVVHRYPQRVLFLVSNTCSSLCRFCTRKRMVDQPEGAVHKDEIERSIDYIASNPVIQDVLLSGGDPLTFSDERLDYILGQLRLRAPHVMFIRIGSRMAVQNPFRITPALCAVLERHDVQMVNIHINHPKEITPELRVSMRLLTRSVMVGCQTVCLAGVNDCVDTLRTLFMMCLEMKVRPYYVYSTDMVEGAHHFVVSHARMLELYEGLRGWISGPAVPTFVVDGLGGLGKLPIIPQYVTETANTDGSTSVVCRNYRGDTANMPYLASSVTTKG